MADLILKGILDLSGDLKLIVEGGRVLVGSPGREALVVLPPGDTVAHCPGAPPVLLPPSPSLPLDGGVKAWIVDSLNRTVAVGSGKTPEKLRPLVTQGLAMQGNIPTWPFMIRRSDLNPSVTVNRIPINIVGDMAQNPQALPVVFTDSGQA